MGAASRPPHLPATLRAAWPRSTSGMKRGTKNTFCFLFLAAKEATPTLFSVFCERRRSSRRTRTSAWQLASPGRGARGRGWGWGARGGGAAKGREKQLSFRGSIRVRSSVRRRAALRSAPFTQRRRGRAPLATSGPSVCLALPPRRCLRAAVPPCLRGRQGRDGDGVRGEVRQQRGPGERGGGGFQASRLPAFQPARAIRLYYKWCMACSAARRAA